MKKFEIVNGKWLKNLNLSQAPEYSTLSSAIKISSITQIFSSSHTYGGVITYSINLWLESGGRIEFKYVSTEKVQYKDDLDLLEKILF